MKKLGTLHVCIPLYGYVPVQSFLSFVQLFGYAPKYFDRVSLNAIDGAYVHLTRRKIAKEVLKSQLGENDFVLWVDQDMVFSEREFQSLIESAERFQAPIMTGHYVSKHTQPQHLLYKKTENGFESIREIPPDSVFEVDSAGMGFMLVQGIAFQKIVESAGLEKCFNVIDSETGKEIGEDFLFCSIAKKAGLKLFANSGVRLGHAGAIAFPR